MDILNLLVILTGAADIFLGYLVLTRGAKNKISFTLASCAIIGGIWAVSMYLYQFSIIFSSLFWIKLVYLVVCVWVFNIFYFSLVFPRQRKKKVILFQSFLYWIIAIPLLYSLFFTELWIKDVVYKVWGPETILGPAYIPVCVLWIFFAMWGSYNLFRWYLISTGIERERIKYVFTGMTFMVSIISITDGIIPLLTGSTRYFQISPLAPLFFVGFTAYAITRYRLMDIRQVVARAVAYFSLVITLAAIYSLGLFSFTTFITEEPTTITGLGISTLLAVIIAFSFQPFLKFFERITDKIFYREKYDESNLLHELALIMASRIRLGDLTCDLLKKLLKETRISRGAFVLIDDKKIFHLAHEGYAVKPQFSQEDLERLMEPSEINIFDELSENNPLKEFMRKLDMSVIIPLHTKTEQEDILILGEKLSGDPYTDQDIRLLEVFAPEVAVAIANASSVERLLRLDEVKSEFITVVSHQLRTPLSVARWNFELLLEGAFGKLPRKVGLIVRDTYQTFMALNQGLNNLVSALEVEEGKVTMRYERVEVNRDIIGEAIAALEREAQLKNITIRRRLSFKRTIVVDRQKMKKVVEALLDNAIRYSPKSSTVTITTRWQKTKGRSELLISVEDEGIGVPDENHEIIFQKFFRGEEAKAMSPGGFGLNLFTARGYVKLHKGRLWAEKKSGWGSLFHVLIPVSGAGRQ